MKKRKFTDTDFEMFVMPFGKYRNWTLTELPPHFILWMLDQNYCPEVLREWGEINEEDLKEQVELSDSFYDSY